MKREILFRGKSHGDEWIEGSLVMVYDKGTGITYPCIVVSYDNDSYDWTEVNPDTVVQFTGLLDKNGVKIFEGDILSEKWKAQVYQNDDGAYMMKFGTNHKVNKPMTLKKYLRFWEFAGWPDRDCEVIGNIHDNPELLKP